MVLHYCDKCGWRVSTEELDAGTAVRLDADRVLCAACAAKEPKSAGKGGASGKSTATARAVAAGKSTGNAKAIRASGQVALPNLSREARTSKQIPHVHAATDKHPQHRVEPPARHTSQAPSVTGTQWLIGGAGVVAVLVVGMFVLGGRHNKDKPADTTSTLTDQKTTNTPDRTDTAEKNTPPNNTPDTQRKTGEIPDVRDEVAVQRLALAKSLLQSDAVYACRDKLQDLISSYGSTPAAQNAKKLLAELKLPGADDGDWSKAVNLMPLLDPSADTVNGTWQSQNGVLTVERKPLARIEIPYTPPEEYDFRISFTRLDGEEDVNMMLVANGKSFLWSMGCDKNKAHGFEMVNNKDAKNSVTGVKVDQAVSNGTKHTAVVQVRRCLARAFLDGNMIREFTTDYGNVGMRKDWALRSDVLGLGAHQGKTSFEKIEVREVTGKGKATR
jgi:hypothetical protein